jgi:hypothetical protein
MLTGLKWLRTHSNCGLFGRGNTLSCFTEDIECEISSSHGGEYDVQSCLLG